MGWFNGFPAFRAVGAGAKVEPSDETVIRSASSRANRALGRGSENPVGHPDAQVAEEIKRRQIALITRYVTTARSR
ncbi:hypothetical protein BURK1_01311 [Burkholderiales bacterium]|nr:hypothetical protein BURK1_01311 [Burkholderiales bacterium]